MSNPTQNIMKELKVIRRGIEDLNEKFSDHFLTPEEEKLLRESYEEEARGELTSSEDLLKELSNANRIRKESKKGTK